MIAQDVSIRIYHGDPVNNAAEIACIRRLERDLRAAGIGAVILANIILGPKRRQIDLIVATACTAIVVEIKAYVHPVHGGVNGSWSLEQDDGSRRALGSSNPYQQALENRFTVTDSLRAVVGVDVRDAVGGILCHYPAAPMGSIIPAGDFKLAIGGYADLIALLQKPRSNALPLERWSALADVHGLSDVSIRPPTGADRIIAEYLAAHADLGHATLDPYAEPVRGLGLHKLMEEILEEELAEDAGALAGRARELATQLLSPDETDESLDDIAELAQTVLRTLALPDVATLRPRLRAELPIYALIGAAGDAQPMAGRADAVTRGEDGAFEVVVDWKSDIAPGPQQLADHVDQLRLYLEATGAPRGALVYMSLGRVRWVEPAT